MILPSNLTHATFCNTFNQHITLPHTLFYLTLDDAFNQPITLPHTLFYLTLGDAFNQPIKLPLNQTHLTLGRAFNQEINLINIMRLKICTNNNIINFLPNSIKELELAGSFNSQINDLPNYLTKFIFNIYKYYHELNSLPNLLKYIKLQYNYNILIKKFPKNLLIVECYKQYTFIDNLKKQKFTLIFSPFPMVKLKIHKAHINLNFTTYNY